VHECVNSTGEREGEAYVRASFSLSTILSFRKLSLAKGVCTSATRAQQNRAPGLVIHRQLHVIG